MKVEQDLTIDDAAAASRSYRHALLAALVVLALVLVVESLVSASTSAEPRVVEGWAQPNQDGTAIGLFERLGEGLPGEGYIVAGAWWEGPDGISHQGGDLPTCIGSNPQTSTQVRLGVVPVNAPEHGGRWDHVVWVECLDRPKRN